MIVRSANINEIAEISRNAYPPEMVSTHNAESNRKQRQAQIFTSLMQNWGDVTKYVTAETNSAGLAQDRYAIYLDNVEAAQNRVTVS